MKCVVAFALVVFVLIADVSAEEVNNVTNGKFLCTNDTRCHEALGSQYFCVEEVCKHKDLWPMDMRDIVAAIAIFVGGTVAAGAGIGGGGIFVPVLILLAGFESKDGIPLSNAMIGGAALANYIQLGPRRHPNVDRPLIYYDMAILMQPLTLCGTIIGVLLHEILPNFVILLILITVLFFSMTKSLLKGISLFKAETIRHKKKATIRINDSDSSGSEVHLHSSNSQMLNEEYSNDELNEMVQKAKKTPIKKILLLFGLLVLLISYSLIVGGKGSSILNIEICSTEYWLAYWSIFPLFIAINVFIIFYLVKDAKNKERLEYPYAQGDVPLLPKRAMIIAGVSTAAGVLASLIGIGGGMVLSPLMLELGVLPDVTAATSSFMILFTAFSAVVQFFVVGRFIWDYGLVFSLLGIVSSVLGQILLDWIIRKTDRKSIIVFGIALIIAAAAILLGYTGTINLIRDIQQKNHLGFHNFCE